MPGWEHPGMPFRHYRGKKPPRFAHPSEQELAELLDANGIAWEYEPHTFPLEHHPDGRVREAFTPDFYLPDIDSYLECTAQKQAHVGKKNRKARKLRERYGAVVSVLYARDLRRLRETYSGDRPPERASGP